MIGFISHWFLRKSRLQANALIKEISFYHTSCDTRRAGNAPSDSKVCQHSEEARRSNSPDCFSSCIFLRTILLFHVLVDNVVRSNDDNSPFESECYVVHKN